MSGAAKPGRRGSACGAIPLPPHLAALGASMGGDGPGSEEEEEEEPSSPVLAPFKISLTPTKGGKLGVSVQKQHVEGPARVKLLGGREEGKSFCSSLGGRMAVEIS